MDNAWRYLTQGGKVVFVGICNGTLEIDGAAIPYEGACLIYHSQFYTAGL